MIVATAVRLPRLLLALFGAISSDMFNYVENMLPLYTQYT